MQVRSPRLQVDGRVAGSGIALAHARALHQPVPPARFDDDGYLCADSSHMPESEVHFPVLGYWHAALYAHYRRLGRRVCVLADMLLLVDADAPSAAVVPDVMVVFDRDPGDRTSYKVWEEGKAPDFVLEVLSASTWRTDVYSKPGLYADLGVREYWTFDPGGIRHDAPPLEGWQLARRGPRRKLPPQSIGRWHSALLGLDLVPEGRHLWLQDPTTGETLLSPASGLYFTEGL